MYTELSCEKAEIIQTKLFINNLNSKEMFSQKFEK